MENSGTSLTKLWNQNTGDPQSIFHCLCPFPCSFFHRRHRHRGDWASHSRWRKM